MRKGRVIFSMFLIALAAFAIHSALHWSFKTALFPLSVSIPLLLLATIQLLLEIYGVGDAKESAAIDLDFSTDVPAEVAQRRVVSSFSWIVAFIISVYLIGFPLTVPLFIFLHLKFHSKVSWPYTLAVTALTWGGFYALFQRLVHLQFEAGSLQTWFGL